MEGKQKKERWRPGAPLLRSVATLAFPSGIAAVLLMVAACGPSGLWHSDMGTEKISRADEETGPGQEETRQDIQEAWRMPEEKQQMAGTDARTGILQPLEGEDPHLAGELAARCVVRLEVAGAEGEFYGSGVLWDREENGLILATAGHLLGKGEELKVFFSDGKVREGTDAAVSSSMDIGFATVFPDPTYDSGSAFPSMKDAPPPSLVSLHQRIFDTLDETSPLLVVACSPEGTGDLILETSLLERDRYLETFGTEVMLLDCRGREGMSGGGVFDGYGNLAGLVAGGNDAGLAVLSMERINDAFEELYGRRRDSRPYENLP